MRLKKGVRVGGVSPEISVAIMVVDSIYGTFSRELVITSMCEDTHSERSAHYRGDAFDCRTYYFNDDQKEQLVTNVERALGTDFIVILEEDHLHVQFSPKKP